MISAELISRLQFAFTISFHILFPAFSIGLATFLVIMEGLWLKTKQLVYYDICRFWVKVFAITFGMGVASGIVMEFQLGTNWSGMTRVVGPVLGVLFTYEVLTAFFIEAGFLGVMLFGWHKVGRKLHFTSTLLVFIGVTLSAFWILSANSWMQTPAGAHIDQSTFYVDNWLDVILNPSVIPRFFHMLFASYLSTALVISAICAYYIMNKKHVEFSKVCLSFSLWTITILIPLQIILGDVTGLIMHEYQPVKTAAIEGLWETTSGVPLLLFALIDQKSQANVFAIGIPYLASLINTHDANGTLAGLKTVSSDLQPWVAGVFYSFRIMVGCGMLILVIASASLVLRLKGGLYNKPWFLKTLILASPLGFISIITGWFTAEIGRQPWVVYGLLRTHDALSNVSMKNVIISFSLIFIVYGIIFGIFYFRYLFRVIGEGPGDHKEERMPFSYLQDEKG
jgi:cytochrome bd ubiquinol oxidase subunit I